MGAPHGCGLRGSCYGWDRDMHIPRSHPATDSSLRGVILIHPVACSVAPIPPVAEGRGPVLPPAVGTQHLRAAAFWSWGHVWGAPGVTAAAPQFLFPFQLLMVCTCAWGRAGGWGHPDTGTNPTVTFPLPFPVKSACLGNSKSPFLSAPAGFPVLHLEGIGILGHGLIRVSPPLHGCPELHPWRCSTRPH